MRLPRSLRSAVVAALVVVALIGVPVRPEAAGAGAGTGAMALTSAEGDLVAFGPPGATRAGLHVWVAEEPSLATSTDAAGHWRIEGIPVGSVATFALEGGDQHPIRTATFTVPEGGLERVTFQSPTTTVVAAFAQLLGVVPDPARCHIASTVTRRGYSLSSGAPDGTHGEPGATVTIHPVPAQGGAPIYFTGTRADVIWPDRALRATTADGGVLFANVTPGTYTLRAHKAGTVIEEVAVGCWPGTLTNASPPWGLQVRSGGLEPDETVPFPTSPVEISSSTTSIVGSLPPPAGPPEAAVRPAGSARPATAVPGAPAYAG